MYNQRMSLYNPFVHYLPTKTVNNNTACETSCPEMLDRRCNCYHFSPDFHRQKYLLHRQNGSTPHLGHRKLCIHSLFEICKMKRSRLSQKSPKNTWKIQGGGQFSLDNDKIKDCRFSGHVSVTKCTDLYQALISLFVCGLIVFAVCSSIHTSTTI